MSPGLIPARTPLPSAWQAAARWNEMPAFLRRAANCLLPPSQAEPALGHPRVLTLSAQSHKGAAPSLAAPAEAAAPGLVPQRPPGPAPAEMQHIIQAAREAAPYAAPPVT